MHSSPIRIVRYVAISWLLGLAVLALGMTSCSPPPKEYDISPPSFVGQPQIALNVATMRITQNYTPPQDGRHVEHLFPTTPADAVALWAHQRLRTAGAQNELEVLVQNASVVETKLPIKKGVTGSFTDEPSERYDASLTVEMRIYSPGQSLSVANVSTQVSRMREATKKMSVYDRRQMFAEMTKELMQLLDQSITAQMQQYFAPYIMGPVS